MATTASTSATQNDLSQLSEYQQLYNLWKGTPATTTTRTTSSNVTAEGVQSYIDSMMSGTTGLANVQAGQKGAGLYSSSTNRLLTNKLTSDVAAKAAAASAGTTETTTTSGGSSNGSGKAMAAYGIAKSLAGSSLGKEATSAVSNYLKKKFTEDATTSVSGAFTDTGVQSVAPTMSILEGIGNQTTTDTGLSLFDFGDAAASAAGDVATDTVSDAASGGFTDWLGSFFAADGGRIPKRNWADGGRVSGLTRSNIGALPTMNTLGKYSYAGFVSPQLASVMEGAVPSTGEETTQDGGVARGNFDPMTAEDLAARQGPGLFDGRATQAISDIFGVDQDTASRAATKAGGAVVGVGLSLANPAGVLGLSGPAASLVNKGARSAIEALLFDDPMVDVMEANNQARMSAGLEALDTGTKAGQARGVEAEQAMLNQENDKGLAQDIQDFLDAQNKTDKGTDGNSTNDDDAEGNQGNAGYTSSTTADDANSAPSGSLSSESDWATGGRVPGDKNYGVDDVPVKLGAKAGGGQGMLDGGEMVLTASTTQKLDKALGPAFLDRLNKNPEALIRFMLNGTKE